MESDDLLDLMSVSPQTRTLTITKSRALYKLEDSRSDTCYFLRLPPVRFLIYRLIFIPQPAHYFLDPDIPNNTDHVEWWLLEPTKVQNRLDTMIFRTNHQINAEATSLLYRELTLVVCPTDIAVLRQLATQQVDIVRLLNSSYHVWLYDHRCPVPIMSHSSMAPGPIYPNQPLYGKMYPHIFARFHNIILNLSLGYLLPLSGGSRGFTIDRAGNIPPDQLESFAAETCSTNLIRDFVTLLSHSPSISILWITLDIHAWPIHIRFPGKEGHRLQKVANMKAAEIWLECGVLDPLKELTNVECAILNVRRPTEDCFATLQPEYAAIAEQLEEYIESRRPMD